MNTFWKTLIFFALVTVVAVQGAETAGPKKQVATPVVIGKPDTIILDYTKLNVTELLAQAKESTRKTRDDLEAVRGLTTMKNTADEQKAKLDQTCSRVMGETMKKLAESATKSQQESVALAKEIERRLALQKTGKKP